VCRPLGLRAGCKDLHVRKGLSAFIPWPSSPEDRSVERTSAFPFKREPVSEVLVVAFSRTHNRPLSHTSLQSAAERRAPITVLLRQLRHGSAGTPARWTLGFHLRGLQIILLTMSRTYSPV
jgi:hypothetical protein